MSKYMVVPFTTFEFIISVKVAASLFCTICITHFRVWLSTIPKIQYFWLPVPLLYFRFFPNKPADLPNYLPANLQICRTADLPTCRLVYQPICRPADLSTYLPANLKTCRHIYLLIWRPADPPTYLPADLSNSWPVNPTKQHILT